MDDNISTAEDVFVKPEAKAKVRTVRMTVGGGKGGFIEIFNTTTPPPPINVVNIPYLSIEHIEFLNDY